MFLIFWLLLELLSIDVLKAHPKINEYCILGVKHEHLICQRLVPKQENFSPDIKTLELRKIEENVIDLKAILKTFINVENITIYGGNVEKIIPPDENNKIKVLQLLHLGVDDIENTILDNFPNLETLNLVGNHLQSFKSNFPFSKLKKIYLAGNRWNCSEDLNWVYRLNQSIVKDLNNLTCFGNPHPNRSLLTIAHFMKDLKKQCPSKCYCTLPKVVLKHVGSKFFEPVIEVNCSYRGLTELPPNLPPYTKIIRLEGNEIEDLKPLKTNPVYRKTTDLYLDNNKVKSIEELEGSYWLKHFRVFSLSGNRLAEIPTYALDNALEHNKNMPKAVIITLGGNPWRCDCVFTPVFQEMLQKRAPQIQKLSEVKCSYVEGDENSLLPIIELSRSSVCRSPSEYSVQALDLLNGVLASLILLILGKLAYDYYYFKKTGRLPWIVTKMP